MKKGYANDCTSRSPDYTWLIRFKNDREDLNDDQRLARPEAHDELVEKFVKLLVSMQNLLREC